MNLTEKQMISVLREEYDARLNYFLKERISIKDKRGVNVVADAVGLKVRDKAGFEYTVGGIVKKGDEEFIKLFLPEFGRELNGQEATSPLNEDEAESGETFAERGFISRKSAGMRDVDYDADSGFAGDDYLQDDYIEDDPESPEDDQVSYSKKKERKYILVPLGEFEERFEV